MFCQNNFLNIFCKNNEMAFRRKLLSEKVFY